MTKRWRATAQKLGLLLALAPGILAVAASPETQAEQEQRRVVSLSLSHARPLTEAIDALEKRFGWVITYEEPPWLYAGDVVDVTASVRRDGTSSPKVFVANSVPFNFEYDIPAERSEPDEDTLLRALLDRYDLSGNPGVFRIDHSSYAFHVVPSRAKNLSGVLESHHSLLDTNISIPADSHTAIEMVSAIVAAINAGGDVNLQVGMIPINLFVQTRLEQSTAVNENARAVLLRTLAATQRKLSWRLLYSAGTKECALNIHMVD